MLDVRAPLLSAAIAYLIGGFLGPWVSPCLLFGWLPRLDPRLALALLALGAGGLSGGLTERRAAAPSVPLEGPIPGRIEAVHLQGEATRITLSPDAAPRQRILISHPRRPPPGLAAGARALTFGPLRAPRPALNPGDLDGRAWAARRGARWWSRGGVALLEPAPAHQRALQDARVEARRRLEALEHPVGAGLLAGLLLGDRRAVDAGAVAALRASGMGHLLAVSGLHVGGLAAALFALLTLLTRRWATRPDRIAGVGGLLGVIGFVLLAQAPLSARRAGLMVGLYLIGRLLDRRPDPLNLLGAAALLLMGADPSVAREPGFQLSFGAVLALLCAPRGRGRWVGAVVVALVAAAATAPTQAWHFGVATPIAPVANLILAPFAALILVPLGLLGLLIAPLTEIPLVIAAVGAEALYAVAEVFAAWAPQRIVGAHMAPLLGLPIAAFGLWRLRARWAWLLLPALAAWTLWLSPKGDRIEVIAVGQGEALLLHSGDHAALVDAGPDPEARAALNHLRFLGVERLDLVIITHHHRDHWSGLAAIRRAIPVARVLDHGRRALIPGAEAVDEQIEVGLGRLRLKIRGGAPPSSGENDASLVIRVEGPARSALLIGDLEVAGERRLLEAGVAPAELLKSPHHGSLTSSDPALLDAVAPRAALISVGEGNRFGVPHPEILRRYRDRGIEAWRTDEDGRLRVRLDTPTLRVEGHRPRAPR